MNRTFKGRWIGEAARQGLTTSSGGICQGVTSRGAFLALDGGSLLFLSRETYRGPLTVNLDGDPPGGWLQMAGLTGSRFSITQKGICFRGIAININPRSAKTWRPDPIPNPADFTERHIRLVATTRAILAGHASPLAQSWLPVLAGLPPGGELGSDFPRQELERLHSLARHNRPDLAAGLARLLGRGPGLTPSGDDFICGFLLARQRWGVALNQSRLNPVVIEELCRLASQRTTTLSAALIECATRGQADERLVLACDSLIVGNPAIQEAIEALQNWGATSGGDALAGLALAFSLEVPLA